MDIGERQEFVRMLAEKIDVENQAIEELGERLKRG
jgi:hypothetical protein